MALNVLSTEANSFVLSFFFAALLSSLISTDHVFCLVLPLDRTNPHPPPCDQLFRLWMSRKETCRPSSVSS